MNDRTGFHIGQDFARYGRLPPADAPKSVHDGYTASMQNPHREKSNRFINKWLQLRLNALIRNKLVAADITPQLIESMDADLCPITGIKLTHATGKESDWSIDRISNDYDYIPTNLIIMSTRANKAKGDKSADEIIKLATSVTNQQEGLDARAWQRMAELMQWARYRQMSEDEIDKTDSTELFISSLFKGEEPFEKTCYSQIAVFQMYLLRLVDVDQKIPPILDATLNRDKQARLLFHKLWKRLLKRKPHYLPSEQYKQWSNQTTLILYVKWVMQQKIDKLGLYLTKHAGSQLADRLDTIQQREEKYSR